MLKSLSALVVEVDSVRIAQGPAGFRPVAGELLDAGYLKYRRWLSAGGDLVSNREDSPMMIGNNAAMEAILAGYVTGKLDVQGTDHTKLHLVKAPFTPTVDMDPASLTEADYAGYAALNLDTWQAPSYAGNGVWETMPGTLPSFVGNNAATTNTIYGWFLVDSAGDCVAIGTFNPGVPNLGDPAYRLTFVPVVQMTPNGWTANPVPL